MLANMTGITPKPRGEDPVADLADPITNTLKPLGRKCTLQVATQVAVAVTLHGDAVPATR